MRYPQIRKGTFISRPNRFIAYVNLDGETVTCHVKNTGRCRELLVPGSQVILQYHPDAAAQGRKTEYSLVEVYKEIPGSEPLLINMDSQAPNLAAFEWLSGRAAVRSLRTSYQSKAMRSKSSNPSKASICPSWIYCSTLASI